MSFPRYEQYKNSGVEWLGEVPAHWCVTRLKFAVLGDDGIQMGPFGGMLLDLEQEDTGFKVYGQENTISGDFSLGRRWISAHRFNELRRYELRSGDIVLTRKGSLGNARLIANLDRPGIADSDTIRIRPDTGNVSPRFLALLLHDVAYVADQILWARRGAVLAGLNTETIANIYLLLPPRSEQDATVVFIDRETAKIDALVAEQQNLIALLKEKRQALISHAVTKGLDPAAPMKDSGVVWLGEVPAHWEIRKVSSISTKITNGYVGPTRDILVEEGVRYLQSLHIKDNRIIFDQPYYVTDDWSNKHAKSVLETGDVLIVQTGDIGQVAVVTDDFAGCNCHALIIVAPVRSAVTGDWLSWVLNSDYGLQSLLSIQTGALHPHLNCGNVKDIYVPIPPIAEQITLVSKLIATLAKFDELIAEAEAATDLLGERRTALISAAVTGKIDVRGLAANVLANEMEAA